MEDIQTQLDQCKLLLDRAEVGLWEADFVQRSYICSDYLMSIFGKKGNNLSFFEFYYIIREDFRDLITTDFLSIQSVDTYEQIFPIITPTGEKWVRSRLCERKLNNGVCVKALGILQIGNYIPVYTSLSIIITNSHKLIGIEFVRNKERR